MTRDTPVPTSCGNSRANLFATLQYNGTDGRFTLTPQGGLKSQVYVDLNGTYHNSSYFLDSRRPQRQVKGDVSFFFNTGSLGHELKAGFGYQYTQNDSIFGWGGDGSPIGDSGPLAAKTVGLQREYGWARFKSAELYYSLLGRDIEHELVPFVRDAGIGVFVWSPLAGGLLSGKFSRENQKPEGSRRSEFDFPIVDKERTWKILDVMAPIAKAHGCSPARISLAWLLTKPVVTSVILGAKRLDQLQDNLAAAELKLTKEEVKQLDEVSALPPEYPGWMLSTQGADRLDPAVSRFKQ